MKFYKDSFSKEVFNIFNIMIDINEKDQNLQLQEKIVNTTHLQDEIIVPTLGKFLDVNNCSNSVAVKVIYCNEGIENALGLTVKDAKLKGKVKNIRKFINDIVNDENIEGDTQYDKLKTRLSKYSDKSNISELTEFFEDVIE